MSIRQEQGKAKAETIGRAKKMSSRQEQGKVRTANISGKRDHGKTIKPEHLEQRETQEQLEQEESTRSSRRSFFWPQWAPVTVMTESTGGDARAITANDVSMSMTSLSRSFKSPDVRHNFLYRAAMTTTTQASASLNTCCNLANSDSESTDTFGRAAWRERTETQHAPEFELLAGAPFCAASAIRTRARTRFHCQGLWW